MKKLFFIAFAMLLVIPALFAQETPVAISATVSSEQLLQRLSLMSDMLLVNIESMVAGMDTIIENLSSQNVTALVSLQSNLVDLHAQLNATTVSSMDEFSRYRTEATRIVTEFRQTASSLTTPEQRNELRVRVNEINSQREALRERQQLLRERVLEHNERVVRVTVDRARVSVGAEIEVSQIVRELDNMTRERAQLIREQVNEEVRRVREIAGDIGRQVADSVRSNVSAEISRDRGESNISILRNDTSQDLQMTREEQLRRELNAGVITQAEYDRRMATLRAESEVNNTQMTREEQLRRELNAGVITQAEYDRRMAALRAESEVSGTQMTREEQLRRELNAGVITQAEYDRRMAALRAESEVSGTQMTREEQLRRELNAGVISQVEYDRRLAALNADVEASASVRG